MKYALLSFLIYIGLSGCQQKKNNEENTNFFPAISFIKSQVAHVDSSIYRITKITLVDSISDTAYIKREDFKKEAAPFLSLPDIASKELKDDYAETKLYMADINQVSLSYMPKKEGELSREEVLIKPGNEGDKVSSIIFNRSIANNDSTVQQVLFWEVDKRFRITTLTRKPNAPERKQTVEVSWNNYASAQ